VARPFTAAATAGRAATARRDAGARLASYSLRATTSRSASPSRATWRTISHDSLSGGAKAASHRAAAPDHVNFENFALRNSNHSRFPSPYGRNFSITPCSSLNTSALNIPSLFAAGESIRLLESFADI